MKTSNSRTERPILFSDAMVRAILEKRKTQTRRVAKLTVAGHVKEPRGHRRWHPADPEAKMACPYGTAGDRLWVREAWQIATGRQAGDAGAAVRYRDMDLLAVNMPSDRRLPLGLTWDRWRPSIHMPRWASRITLEIADVRIERLQQICETDARAEGSPLTSGSYSHRGWYRLLWDEINAKRGYGWDVNPLVWVVEFKVIPHG